MIDKVRGANSMEIGQYEMNSGERVITQDDGKLDIKYLTIISIQNIQF